MTAADASPDLADELRLTAKRLLDQASDSASVRRVMREPAGFDQPLWSRIADLGWLSIAIPEELGGAGGRYTDVGVLLEEFGAHVTPTPYLGALVAIDAISRAPNAALRAWLLPELANGSSRAAIVTTTRTGDVDHQDVRGEIGRAGGMTFSGTARFVLDAATASYLVVGVDTPTEPVVVCVAANSPGIRIEPVRVMDPTRRLSTVVFEDVRSTEAELLGHDGGGGILSRINSVGGTLVMADALGAAHASLNQTISYLKIRHQFGRPVGSFQAVKHKVADMALKVAQARVAVTGALCDIDRQVPDMERKPSLAKAYVGPAAVAVCAEAVQLHGGIGYTWEYDAHLFMKRARLDDALFGSARWHRRAVLAHVLSSERDMTG